MTLPYPDRDSTVLITGASSGIGTELARGLARRGHNVTLVARRENRLQTLADELIERHRIVADVQTANLSAQRTRGQLIKTLKGGDRRVAAVVNNAGFGSWGHFADLTLARETEMVRLNVDALHELTGAFLDDMIEHGAGAILNVASTAAFQPMQNMATYAATKAFVLAFSEAVHAELAGTGVTCTTLCPGLTRTEFQDVAATREVDGKAPDFLWMTAADVAEAAIDGMIKGKRTVVPGIVNRVGATAGRVTPRSVLLPLVGRFGSAGGD